MQKFFQYCVCNLELIIINKIVILNNQNGSFDIKLPLQNKFKYYCSQTNPEFKNLNIDIQKLFRYVIK